MQKKLMLPVEIKFLKPYDGNSADLKLLGKGFDNNTYAIKCKKDGPLLPITEWVCYHLCRSIGIKTPEFAIVKLLDDSLAFGSKWGNYEELSPKAVHEKRLETYFQPPSLKNKTENIYTTDFFIPNEDRHFFNLMWEKGETLGPIAFDFSRAWLIKSFPFGNFPLPMLCNTYTRWSYLKSNYGYQPSLSAIEKIKNLPDNWFEHVINLAPQEWIPENIGDTLNFWKNNRRQRCEDAIKLM